ncbi:MAG TPA: UDP-3-O-(3-hydroxymyristoyl)glucosamine N-acyltransferase [Acidobacteriaceae bacterium]|nr:UDP-3-O-(3-hydroxymyristoyl)glucosamine N-acyltransferase [Acidobacteriaceae bacterium]
MRLGELAETLGVQLHGNPELEITGVAGLESASAGQVSFVANPKYAPLAKTTAATAIIVDEHFPEISTATLRTPNPYHAFARAISIFHPPAQYAPGIHPTAVIDPTATLGPGAHIGAYVVVSSGTRIGANAILLPHSVIYANVTIGDHFFAHSHAIVREGCRIGDRVTLQNGAIVGCDGFGFSKDGAGHWSKIPQSGPAVIGDDVEIQANACVDRASVGETVIARGAKLDNFAHIGHSSTVGEDTLICAQTGLAGSSHIGKNVILAGQVGIAGHLTIGDGVIMTAQSGTSHDVPPGKVVSGTPAFENRQWRRASAVFTRLPELSRIVSRLARANRDETPS